MEDNKDENDQMVQEFERKLKVRNTKVEKPFQNPYTDDEQKFDLIRPMFDMVVNQMNVVSSCFTVHAHISFTDKEVKELSKDVTGIPQQLSEILVESVSIRSNLIDIIGAMERLSYGITRFVKIANNPKFRDKPLTEYLHFVEKPKESLKVLLEKKCELNTEKVNKLEKNLASFMECSGNQAIPDWIKYQSQCQKDLEALEKKRQEKLIEDIAECDEVSRIISEIEFYQTKLKGHEHLKKDLQNEKKILQNNRDYLERQVSLIATSSKIMNGFRFMRNNDLEANNKIHALIILRKQKMLIKEEIFEITSQENIKILDEAECKKALVSLWEMLKAAQDKVELAKANKESQLKKIDEEIEKKREQVKKFEDKIAGILKKYGNPSIDATCLMLESIARLAIQRTESSGTSGLYYNSVNNFLGHIEEEIHLIYEVKGDRNLLDDEWLSTFETSILPLNFFVSEIRPIIRNSIHENSPEKLISYSSRKSP